MGRTSSLPIGGIFMSAPHLHYSDKKLGCAGKIGVVALSLDTELLRLVGRFAFCGMHFVRMSC